MYEGKGIWRNQNSNIANQSINQSINQLLTEINQSMGFLQQPLPINWKKGSR
jgi:hypothetical protein